MLRLLLLLLLIVPAFIAHAQRDFRPGYILQNADTIKGFINYRTHKANSSVCQFKATPDSDIQKFKASEITGYGFTEGIHFHSRLIKEKSQAVPNRNEDPKYYFLNLLVSGKADLYYVRDISGKDRYFIQKDTVFKELESHEIRVVNKESGMVYKGNSKLYVGTLSYLFNDCKPLQPAITTTKLSPLSLARTFKKYNQCIHPDSLYFEQKQKKSITSFGVTFGTVYSNVKFSPPYKATEISATYNSKPGYSFGAIMNYTLPFLNNKLSFQSELLFVRNNFQVHYLYFEPLIKSEPESGTIYYQLKGNVTRYSLRVPVQLRYTFNFQKLKPFLNIGFNTGTDIKVENEGLLEGNLGQDYRKVPITGYYKRDIYSRIIGGLGLDYTLPKDQTIFLELRYTPEGIHNLFWYSSTINSWMLHTGFRF